MSLHRVGHSSREVLPSVVCLGVIVKLRKRGGRGPLGTVAPQKKSVSISQRHVLDIFALSKILFRSRPIFHYYFVIYHISRLVRCTLYLARHYGRSKADLAFLRSRVLVGSTFRKNTFCEAGNIVYFIILHTDARKKH